MKYLDTKTGETIIILPWSSSALKYMVKNNPDRYHKLFEEE